MREWTELRLTDSSGKVQSASELCLLLRYCPSGFSQLNVSCIHCCPSSWHDLFFFFLSFALWNSGKFLSDFQTFLIWLASPKVSLSGQYHACLLSCFSLVWLCNPLDHSLPGSSVHEILQARILEWVAMSSSREIFWTQGSNPCLLHWQPGAVSLVPPGKPPVPSVSEKMLVF